MKRLYTSGGAFVVLYFHIVPMIYGTITEMISETILGTLRSTGTVEFSSKGIPNSIRLKHFPAAGCGFEAAPGGGQICTVGSVSTPQLCSKYLGRLDHKNCLKTGVHSIGPKCEGMNFGIGRNALE
jgi:hypothetical protein